MSLDFFKKTPMAPFFDLAEMCVWDIGARGTFDEIFEPFAWSAHCVGFEPDPEAFAKLKPTGKWRSETFIETAIADSSGEQTLNITRDPIGSSFLAHNSAIGERFHLEEMFTVDQRVAVKTLTLQDARTQNSITTPDILKLDVEGLELAILKSAGELLNSVVAIKVEGGFLPHRQTQPLAPELISWLSEQGFSFMDMIEPVKWRLQPWATDPYTVKSVPGYSRGQLVQADFIFLKDASTVNGGLAPKAALAAIGLGYFDHGLEIYQTHHKELDAYFNTGPEAFSAAVAATSKQYGKMRSKQELAGLFGHFGRLIRSYFGGLNVPK